jgi:DNA-directed RNA polymerase subunit RPC12/RpoP
MPNELRKRKSAGSKTAKDTKPLLGTVNDISLSTHLRNSFLLSTPSEQTTYNQESVQHELMSELENTAPPLYVVQGDVCHKCNIPLIILASDALLGCPRCSHTRLYIQATSSRIAYGEEVEFANFSYKRQNHFQVPQSLRLGETARACNY